MLMRLINQNARGMVSQIQIAVDYKMNIKVRQAGVLMGMTIELHIGEIASDI